MAPTHTDQYLQWDSHHHLSAKFSVIQTLSHRTSTVCSNPELLQQEKDHLRKALTKCKFPKWALDKVEKRLNRSSRQVNDGGTNNAQSASHEVQNKGHIVIPYTHCGVSYALCLLSSVLQCWLEFLLVSCLSWCVLLFKSSACPVVLCLMQFSFSKDLDFCSPFYAVYICTALWDSLSGLCALWDRLSGFPGPWLGSCILGEPVWPVIGYPVLGVYPSMSIVRLIVIGYHCNHLDGQLIIEHLHTG